MNIYIASDHAGFHLKEELISLLEKKYTVINLGPSEYISNDDYPDYAYKLSNEVVNNINSMGILICMNGIGVCIVANRNKGIRAVSTTDEEILLSSRVDDDTNVLCLSSMKFDAGKAFEFVDKWLNEKFSNEERHLRRISKQDLLPLSHD